MADLSVIQLGLLALIFIWSGFVRSGLGFGGAALALPLMLLVVDDPLLFLPLISIQLLVFSTLIVYNSHRDAAKAKQLGDVGDTFEGTINWAYLKQSLLIIIIPKLLGVFGLLTLDASLVTGLIFMVISVYAVFYILNKPFKSTNPWMDKAFLILGGYVSGTSLVGAPLIIAVYASHVAKHQLRDTLFVLWFILVVIKVASFIVLDVDMQWIHQLWLLPCVALGHWAGLYMHKRLQQARSSTFYRVLGIALLVISLIGIYRAFLT